MKFSLVVCTFAVLLPGLSFASKDCPETRLQKQTADAKKIADELNKSLSSAEAYFDTACKIRSNEPDGFMLSGHMGKPNTDWLRTRIPAVDTAGRKTQDFLRKVLERIRERHEFNKEIAEKMKYCSWQSIEQPQCTSIDKWMNEELPQISQLARFNLALSHPSSKRSRYSSKSEVQLNANLNENKTYKAEAWKPLEGKEKEQAERAFAEIEKTARDAVAVKWRGRLSESDRDKLYREELTKIRHNHYIIYMSMMGINPVLQFIQSANPSKAEIHTAASKTLENLEKEKKMLDEIEKAVSKPYSVGRASVQTFDDDVLKLLNYRTEVEEVLLENPHFCGLGVALNQIKDNKQMATALVGLTIMGVSFLVPPAYALALGSGASLYAIFDSQNQLSENRVREMARVQREGHSELIEQLSAADKKSTDQLRDDLQKDVTRVYRKNLQELQQSQADRNVNVILGPTVFYSPVALKQVYSYSKSMKSAFQAKQ